MLKIGTCPVRGNNASGASRALLAKMYAMVTGEEMPQIGEQPRGKPYFLTGKYHFSITHTKTRAFCALSDRPVGIDAEELSRKVDPGLAQKILSQSEYAIYEQAPEEERNELLLRFWVLKQAHAKCSGFGLRDYPDHTDFRPDDPRITVRNGCLVAVITEGETEDAL